MKVEVSCATCNGTGRITDDCCKFNRDLKSITLDADREVSYDKMIQRAKEQLKQKKKRQKSKKCCLVNIVARFG